MLFLFFVRTGPPSNNDFSECSSYHQAYGLWYSHLRYRYEPDLVGRAFRLFYGLRRYLGEHYVQAQESLSNGAKEEELDKLEVEMGYEVPDTMRIVYR